MHNVTLIFEIDFSAAKIQ